MGLSIFLFATLVIHGAFGQRIFKTCFSSTERNMCLNLEREDSQAICENVESRVDCAIKLARGEVDMGVFSEEETLLLAHRSPNDGRVVATIRDSQRFEPYAFEAVAVVPASYSGGLAGIRGGKFCHPGFDSADQRWSLRVLKQFEWTVANSDQCPSSSDINGKSADEIEAENLNEFFSAACRPGPWSANTTVDDNLKRRFPNLCSLCGTGNNCTSYSIDMGPSVAGANNNNRHIQALECMRAAGEGAVAYVAWQHVREFFQFKRPEEAASYALLCEDGTTRPLDTDTLNNATSPCAFVRQTWPTIIASTQVASEVSAALQQWWPSGNSPADGGWQATLFSGIANANARVAFETELKSPSEYAAGIRIVSPLDTTTGCIPTRRWCTTSAEAHDKCGWLRSAAHILGIQPSISCALRDNAFQCFREIRDNQLDLYVSTSNYGYLARQHYSLSPVKLVQTSRTNATRVIALVKNSAAQNNITRFENLRGTQACFPEYGGIAYMAFVKTAQDRGVISAQECDYAKAVGEFFGGACAGGAIDASHSLSNSSDFNATTLCTVCKPASWASANNNDFTCAWNSSNLYFGNNGTLACLNDPSTQFAVLKTSYIQDHLRDLGIAENTFRALCRNNTLAVDPGVNVDDDCLLAHVSDGEVITRRNDPNLNALNVLLDTLDKHFGYATQNGAELINFEMYSPLAGNSNLVFKDTAMGLFESSQTTNQLARNYNELFRHLESCTGAAPGPSPGDATRHLLSAVTLAAAVIMSKFVIY